ncbi:transcriptional regulator [Fertoebacter nigrum]|uniref:Transcriptional regulator n=1 Tax=Fertoeibacter niger TaxID=2656921 RepID=A0A8X8GYX3_9RHOB|nr:transcriptional regulator [Fertoeibacter niger]NUB45672.1 transcriptional regulator [Fertoeibacter niger]
MVRTIAISRVCTSGAVRMVNSLFGTSAWTAVQRTRPAQIARSCKASLNHLLKVVNALQAQGFIETLRSRSGFRVPESGTPFAECFDPETNTCPLPETCRLRGYVARAVEAFHHALDTVTLEDLTKGNCGFAALLAVPGGLRRSCAEAALA